MLCPVRSCPVLLLLPWEYQEDKNGDAGGQDDFSFCVQLSLTVLAPAPAHHHLVGLLLAQETPREGNNARGDGYCDTETVF